MQYKSDGQEEDLLAIGRLGSPHGVQGFLRVQSYSGETAHFSDLGDVLVSRGGERRKVRVEESKASGPDVLLRLAGCSDPETARNWTGWEILVPRSRAAPLGPGEYYIADLEGCELVLGTEPVGTVEAVLEGGEAPLLEIRRPGGRSVLIPFRKEFIGKVDVPGRRIELLADWILE